MKHAAGILTGFCNPSNPPASHARCRGCYTHPDGTTVPCLCPHHQEEPPMMTATPSEAWGIAPPPPDPLPPDLEGLTLPDAVALVAAAADRLDATALSSAVAALPWEDAVRLLAAIRGARFTLDNTADALVRHIYLTGEHGPVEVEGVGEVQITRARDRKKWDGPGVAQAVLDAHMADSDGEAPPPWDVAEWLLEAIAVGYARVGVLRGLGLDPDDYCESLPGRPQVALPSIAAKRGGA